MMLRAAMNMVFVAPSSPEAKAKREAPCSGAGGKAFPYARSQQGLLAPSPGNTGWTARSPGSCWGWMPAARPAPKEPQEMHGR